MKTKLILLVVLTTLVLVSEAHARVLVATNSTWRYFKGTSEAPTPTNAWREVDFDDSAWLTGAAPFHYGTNAAGGDDNLTGGTLLADMRGSYTCVFFRQTFVIEDTNSLRAAPAERVARRRAGPLDQRPAGARTGQLQRAVLHQPGHLQPGGHADSPQPRQRLLAAAQWPERALPAGLQCRFGGRRLSCRGGTDGDASEPCLRVVDRQRRRRHAPGCGAGEADWRPRRGILVPGVTATNFRLQIGCMKFGSKK